MSEGTFRAKLAGLVLAINALPPGQRTLLIRLVEETKQRHYALKRDFARLGHAVDDGRLTMKYLFYDLERTRDEVQRLGKKAEQ